MILDNTQWIRLQKTVQEALPFFKTYNLYPEIIKSFEKVSDASLYELQQVRRYEDWPVFLKDLKESEMAPIEMVINFTNGKAGSIDWPWWDDEDYDKLTKEFFSNLESGNEWSKSWSLKHTLFGSYIVKSFLHIDPSLYGKGIWYSHKTILDDGKYHKEWGLVISKKNFVPISVEF